MKSLRDLPDYNRGEYNLIKVQGSNYTWYVPDNGIGFPIFHELEGHHLKINYKGEYISVHEGNTQALLKDTNDIDLTDKIPTMGFIARKREMKNGIFYYSDFIHEDSDYTLGVMKRLKDIAESITERPIYIAYKSPGGTDQEWLK